jgi:5-methyltetrahydropteroyltriglutamate--homocysteine methyltransferase
LELSAYVPGIYPRSEELVQATRDFDRGRTSADAVDEQVARDLDAFVRVQREADVDLLADGMLRWQDLFRPLVEASAGLELGPLTRFLDTNTFFRASHATGEAPRLQSGLDERYVVPLGAPRLVTLPSPYAFSRASGVASRELAVGVLRPAIESLPDEIELVVLAEPFLAREPGADHDVLADALAALGGGPPLALQLTFGDAGPLLPRLAELPVEGVGVDFHATRIDALPEGLDKLVLAGVVDARGSLVEDPLDIARFARRLAEVVERIALTPNGDLQFVSERVAREKVARLGRAKTARVEEAA